MILNVHIGEQHYPVEVPEDLIRESEEFFARMDNDMDRGYQMSRTWVDSPDRVQRCQIAADRMVTGMENGNESLTIMMAAYILSRMPEARAVHIDLEGDMLQHRFETVPV